MAELVAGVSNPEERWIHSEILSKSKKFGNPDGLHPINPQKPKEIRAIKRDATKEESGYTILDTKKVGIWCYFLKPSRRETFYTIREEIKEFYTEQAAEEFDKKFNPNGYSFFLPALIDHEVNTFLEKIHVPYVTPKQQKEHNIQLAKNKKDTLEYKYNSQIHSILPFIQKIPKELIKNLLLNDDKIKELLGKFNPTEEEVETIHILIQEANKISASVLTNKKVLEDCIKKIKKLDEEIKRNE